jgi:hypothetical protein
LNEFWRFSWETRSAKDCSDRISFPSQVSSDCCWDCDEICFGNPTDSNLWNILCESRARMRRSLSFRLLLALSSQYAGSWVRPFYGLEEVIQAISLHHNLLNTPLTSPQSTSRYPHFTTLLDYGNSRMGSDPFVRTRFAKTQRREVVWSNEPTRGRQGADFSKQDWRLETGKTLQLNRRNMKFFEGIWELNQNWEAKWNEVKRERQVQLSIW